MLRKADDAAHQRRRSVSVYTFMGSHQKSWLHTPRSLGWGSVVEPLIGDANRSLRMASRERNSSAPTYAPHMRRFPVKEERP